MTKSGWFLESNRHSLASKGIKTAMKQKNIAIDILSYSEGMDSFWMPKAHYDQKKSEKEAAEYNEALKGTGAQADVQFARNFNMKSIPWAVAIRNFDDKAYDKLMKKYDLKEEDIPLSD